MDGLWSPDEELLVHSRLAAAIVGSRETVREKLQGFIGATEVDEIMMNSDVFDHAKRLRSYEIVAEVMHEARRSAVA
jgi:alkanesulfonate monooxygenase SsuD/methylene tetrahydromethanopterin reductase-like flavin-dependent oxidoreductase (luciferase family)